LPLIARQTSPGFTAGIFILHAVEHHRTFGCRLVAQRYGPFTAANSTNFWRTARRSASVSFGSSFTISAALMRQMIAPLFYGKLTAANLANHTLILRGHCWFASQ
jgi:hypothetical protein